MRFKNITIQFIVLFFFVNTLYANSPKGYKIEVNAPFKEGSVAYLAGYWEDKTYIIDSISIPKDGVFTFENSNKNLETGQYLLYVKPDVQVDFLLDKNATNVKIDVDVKDFSNSKIQGSEDTRIFWNYLKELNVINEELRKKVETFNATKAETKEREQATKEYTHVVAKVDKLVKNYIEKNKGTWVSSFLKSATQTQQPHLIPRNTEEGFENEQYNRNHYLDNIDFEDIRLWNTNILIPRINEYLNNIISQHPDSIAKASSWIVSRTKDNPVAFEKMLSYFVNDATQSLVMGMENVWAKLAEDYIFDKNISWIDKATYDQLKADYSLIEFNRLGMKAQNLKLRTIDGDSINTNEIEGAYTLLYFYSPSCSHCREEIPKLKKEFYDVYKEQGAKVVAINLDHNIEAWKSFIGANEMQEWYNVFDPEYKSEYWMKYNVSGTPSLFLLAKDKTIMAKKLNVENLVKYLERLKK